MPTPGVWGRRRIPPPSGCTSAFPGPSGRSGTATASPSVEGRKRKGCGSSRWRQLGSLPPLDPHPGGRCPDPLPTRGAGAPFSPPWLEAVLGTLPDEESMTPTAPEPPPADPGTGSPGARPQGLRVDEAAGLLEMEPSQVLAPPLHPPAGDGDAVGRGRGPDPGGDRGGRRGRGGKGTGSASSPPGVFRSPPPAS